MMSFAITLIAIALLGSSVASQSNTQPAAGCPRVTVYSTAGDGINVPFSIEATVTNADPNHNFSFEWSVRNGQLTSGQGTAVVRVTSNRPVTATVELKGLPAVCGNVAASVSFLEGPPPSFGSVVLDKPSVEALLRSLDFSVVRVGVANPKRGEKSGARFVEVYGGFSLHSIEHCTATLRNQGVDKGSRFLYEVVIPLNELRAVGSIGQTAGGVGPPGPHTRQEFYPWSIDYDIKSRQRRIFLYDRIRNRVLARGAHVSFIVRDRPTLDKIAEVLKAAVEMCAKL
jgi:hypothetical protein